MIYLQMPVASNFGWGVCGKYVAREMARRTQVQLFTTAFTLESLGDELEYFALRKLQAPPELTQRADQPDSPRLDAPLLQAIRGKDMQPISPNLKGSPSVGYTFFEDNILPPVSLENGRRYFRHITTGCSWCTGILRELGLTDVSTVLQGVDPAIFHPVDLPRTFMPDHFIVFSGGKFEFRKGQDIVIRAFKVLQERHKDVLLITSWYNMWASSLNTMRYSPLIKMAPRSNNYLEAMAEIMSDNGIDVSRTITLLPRPNTTLANIYRNTDVGLFPNRCEGGTNLVLMEYMACGRPVIATATTGHGDVVNAANARVIAAPSFSTIVDANGVPIAKWPEPNLEQTIEELEWAYQHRAELKPLAAQGAADMRKLSWERTAEEFLKVLEGVGGTT